MKRRIAVALCLVFLAATSVALAQIRNRPKPDEGRTRRPTREQESLRQAPPPVISEQVIQKVKNLPDRSLAVGSLLRSTKGRGMLTALTRGKGISAAQLRTRTLAGQQVGRPTFAAAAGATLDVAQLPAYDEINWEAGVTWSPAFRPQFRAGAQVYNLGRMVCAGLCTTVSTGLKELYEQDVMVMRGEDSAGVTLYLDLPAEPANYIITAQIAPSDGARLSDWAGSNLTEYIRLRANIVTELDITELADGSGVVAVATLSGGSTYVWSDEALERAQMRRVNASVTLGVSAPGAPVGVPSLPGISFPGEVPLVFGGITLEKL